jgi:mannosyl-3-phosphoglycerate synthase
MNKIEKRMAIVVSTKNEKIRLVDGVLSGIPHDCLIILVSNSYRKPIDRYRNEFEMMKQFNKYVNRDIIMIHQRDPGLAKAFSEVGYTDILQGRNVRHGKGEGAVIGLILAKMAKRDFIGFIDSDNYIPGAIHEYVKNFNCGFSLASSPYSMVRISWLYKPKVTETGFYFSRWGRVNEATNKYLNRLISIHSSFGTEIIKSGNSGEYAMSMKLAEMLSFASGSSVEPFTILNLLEKFGPSCENENKEVMEKGAQIYQIETRNPHIHVDKGDEHLGNMLLTSIGIIYHSPICNDELRKIMLEELTGLGLINKGGIPPNPPTIGPINGLDFQNLQEHILHNSKSLVTMGEIPFQKKKSS